MSIMLLAVALGMAAKVAQAAKNRATTFVLEKIQGDVRVVSSAKEEKTILEGMQLINGDHQVTGEESYAWMSLDASKAVKLDENSESALKKAWFSKKLEVYSVKGKLFFNVTVPLAEDEAFNIRTSTMVTGIRGTCGWVEVSDDWKSTIYLLTGKLECLVVNPLDNGSQTITLLPGQYAEFFVFPKSEIEGEEASCGVTTKTFTKEDIPGFILEEILGNDELIQKIYEETKTEIDLRDLTPEYVKKRIQEDQEKHKKEKREMEEKASEELTIVEKEPVWKPENIKASAVAYLLMPQKAETVQKYLNQEKYQKVVLVPGSGSEDDNTLKVDIALTTPAGKTLEAYAGVSVDVLANYSFTVDGTALLARLTNNGTVTVRSANTLEIEELLINIGVLEITESGRLVLKKTMETSGSFVNSGVVEAAPDATGDEMIRINGGKVVMLSGMISSNRHDTIMRLADGAQAEFQFAGGLIANEMEDGASILAREEDFQVTVLGTDIMGVTNTILGKGAVLEKYNAGSVFRKDERYHLIELDKVDSYPVVVAKVEHGTIIAPSRVEVGAKVTLTAIPDEGYQLEYLSVNNYNSKTKKVGSSVSLSAEQSFIMPSSDVIVGGSFIEIAGEPKYQVTVRRADGGSVRASATEAKAGETIQITVQNGAGHELEGLTVKDEDGNAVGITTSGNGYAFTMPEMNVTVTPSFRTLEYNVVFYDDDKRTVLNQQTLKYGTIPKYEGTKPEKSTDAQYSYTFLGWQIEEETYAEDAILPDVTGNMVFTAVYAKKIVEGPYVPPTTYTVTWRNWDGTELEKDTGLTNGATPSYDSTIPTRDADVNVSYDFAGWTSSFGEYGAAESLPAVTGDITYTARFTSTTRKYTITWLNYNGELLETDELVPYGSMPTYDGETPEKNVEDPQYSYIFAGWDAAIVPVAGNATYKATYTQELNFYTIRFLNEDGSVMETLENVDYGTMPAYTSIPTKTGDDQYSYDFAGWNPELATVEGDTDYTVVFTQRINKYKVIWLNEGGAPLKTQEGIEYNTIPSYPEASNPTKGTDAQYTYEFAGWKVGTTPYAIGTTLPPVHGDVTFTAYYTPTLRQFDVTFLDEDGTTPIQNTTKFDYGTLATTYAPADPTKTASGQYTYAFAGWTPDNGTTVYTKAQLPMVTDDVVYKATYTTTIHPLSVSLDAQSLDLFVGGTAATLTATITPSDAANQNVLWSSDDESVATVTGNGLTATVTAVANGTATITVKTEDGGYEASCTVTVKTSVTGVNLDKTELTVILGTTESLQATITPATASNKNLIWTSGDNDIVFVSTVEAASAEDVGKVTVHPVAAGTTTITVTTEDGSFEQSCAVIVKGYTVTFVNDDDAHTQLNQQLNVAKDAIPSFAGAAQPSKTATQQYTYTFAGWKNGQATYPVGTALPAVTGDVTYTAYYDDTVNPYNVTFVGEDGASIMKAATAYDYGTLGSDIAVPATAKTSSEEFDYTFAGWIVKGSDGSVKYMTNADLPNVTDHVIYQATYTSTTRSYAIKFHYDGSDNTKVHTQQVAYGTVPVYDGTEPTKTATAQVTYVFAGWQDADGTPGLSSVTGEKEYFATFGTSGNTFAITYDLNAGTDASAKVENAITSYVYGTGATLPTATTVTRDGYEFSGWYTTATPTANDSAITTIGTTESGVKEFYAKWTAKKNTLTLTKAGAGTFSQISVGSAFSQTGELMVDAGIDDPSQPVTYDYETDQTVYVVASVFKGSVGAEVTEMTAPNSITIQDAAGNVITPTYANGFYSFTMPARACTVTVTTVNYQVSIAEVANGSVTTDHENCAEAGDTVVLNIVDVVNGYEFSGFTFKNDADENVTIATTKVNDSQYTFTMPAYNVTVEPAFKLKTFTITFVDEDGTTVLKEATTYEFGTPAADIATPDDPTKEDDADYHYTFNGWTPALAEVTTDQTYKATYKATAIIHVTGVSLNKTAIAAIVDGDPVEISAIIAPEAAENQNVTWSIPEADVAIASVDHDGLTAWVTGLTNGQTTLTVTTEDGNYTASVPVTVTTNVAGVTLTSSSDTAILGKADVILTATLSPVTASNKNVTWTVEDQNVLILADADAAANESGVAKATIVPKATGSTKITVTTVNGSHTADVTITVKGHTVTWVDDDDTVLFEQTNVADSTIPSYPGTAEPSKAQTEQYTYSFKGWKIGTQEYPKDGTVGLPRITGDTTIQAYYTPVIRQYNVTFVGEDGTSVLKEATAYNYNTLGSAIVEPSAPTKQSSDTTTYTFAGWTVANSETVYESGHLPNVTKEVTYIAKYTEADRLYTVTFYDSAKNGSTKLYETTTTYQGHVTYQGEEPTQEEDDTYVYRFNGWIYNNYDLLITDVPSISVIEDINYTAYYNSILKGLFYDITYDGENNSPVLHLYGLKEDHLWHTLDDEKLDSAEYRDRSNNYVKDTITKVVIEDEIHPTSVVKAFAGCTNLKEIENLGNLKLDKADSLNYLFQNCSSLTALDLSGWNTETILSMEHTFEGCSSLTALDVSSFNTSNVTSMGYMFMNCSGLESLDLSTFDTKKVTEMGYMFRGCSSLQSIKLTSFNTANVTNMMGMFEDCTSLTELDLSSFNTAKVNEFSNIFCAHVDDTKLKTIYVSDKFVVNQLANDDSDSAMFFGRKGLVGGQGTAFAEDPHTNSAYACIDDPEAGKPGYFTDKTQLGKRIFYKLSNEDEENVLRLSSTPDIGWQQLVGAVLDSSLYASTDAAISIRNDEITKVVIETEIHPTSMENAFNGCTGLTTITNIENLKTDQVTSMEGAFKDCISLESLDVSNFDTSNVTTMKNMFNNCGGSNLESFGISGWNTSNVTDMSGMFELCYGLVNFDVSSLDTENVTNMSRMFHYCSALKNLNGISSFDTHNVTSMVGMFESCFQLESLDLSEWNTSNVIDMSFMFDECGEMKSLNLSGWDTSNVTDMHTMFAQMRQIEALDLSSFNTAKVEDMNRMFWMENEGMLKAIYVSDDFVLTSETTSEYMFTNCKNLVGGKGTPYESDHVDGTYARIDNPTAGEPGYFTDKTRRIYYKLTDESGEKVLRFSDAPDTGYQQIMGGMLNSSQYVSTDNTITIGKNDITKVIIEKDIYPSNLNGAFYDCGNLTEIVNIDLLHTENVTSMADMFLYCFKLASIDVTGFDTSRVTDLSYMFGYCALLEELDLSSFNTSNVTKMGYMFTDCSKLKTIYATDTFDVTNVTDTMGEVDDGTMFNNCMELVGGMGTKYYLGNYEYNVGDKSYAHVDGRHGQPGYFTDKNYEASIYYNVDVQGADTVLHFYATPADGRTQIANGMLDGEYTGLNGLACEEVTKVIFEEMISPIDMKMAFANFEKLTSFENLNNLDMDSVMFVNGAFSNLSAYSGELNLTGLNTSNVRDMAYMFANSDKLTGIIFGEGFDTSKVENFSATFQGCTGLTSLDLSAWDMESAKDMQYMFYQCSGLTSLNLDNVNTVNVTSMYNTFAGCEELTSLSLQNFKTDSVTTMESMFQDCKKLEEINVSGFDTTNVTDFSYMFLDCYKLTSVDVSGFNTANAEYMFAMFQNCNELTAIDVSGFETSKVKSFSMMFFGCEKLESLDLTNFNTANAKGMAQMFFNCVGLTELDLRSFDTSNVEEFYQMFAADSEMALTKIYASDAFVTTNIVDGYGYGMFTNCNNLIGGNGTPYNASNDDFTYAWIDGKDGQLGYFTNKSGVFYTLNSEDNEVVLHLYAQPRAGRTELMDGKMNSSQYVSTTGGAELNREDITKVVIEEAIEPTGVIGAFNECYSLKSIEGMEYLSTAGLTSMEDMFNECDSLETVDLSHFDTSSVTSMFGMFKNCSSLKELDLSSFDTRNVDSMGYMFYGCNNLRTIYVLDNDLFDVSLVEDSYGPYNDEGWDEDGMFSFCQKLMGGAGTRHWFEYGVWNPIDKEYARIDGKDGLPGYFTLKGSVDESSIYFTLVDDVATGEKVLTFYDEDGTDSPRNRVDHGSMFSEEYSTEDISYSDVTKIVFEDEIYPSAMAYAFNGMSSVTTIENLDKLHTDNVTSLRGVFGGFGYEGDIDLSEWNVSNVVSLVDAFNYSKFTSINVSGWTCPKLTNMEGAFESCSNLTSLTIDSFSAPNLTDLSEAFAFCTSLESITISGMSTPKLEYMYSTFKGNTALKNVNLEGLNTSRVTDVDALFMDCSSLVSIDLSYLDTSSVEDLRSFFEGCKNLETVNLSGWDTANVTGMHSMFRECTKLKEVDLSGFNTSSLTNIGYMFEECYSLTTVDLSSFDTSKVTMSWYMFYASNGDHNLTTIYASDAFDLSLAGESGYGGYMFNGRAGLIGGEGSTVTSGHEDCTYARVDGGAAAPGYFTDKTKIVSGVYYTLQAEGDDVVLKLYGQSGGGRTKLTDDALNSDEYVTSGGDFDKDDIERVVIMEDIYPTSMKNAFSGCSALTAIENIEKLHTENVTDMSGAFENCATLVEIDLSHFDTSKVTDMSHMFAYMGSEGDGLLPEGSMVWDLSSFDTSKVTNMEGMFMYCEWTDGLNLSSFDTSNVTNMAYMFRDMYRMKALDLSSFDTKKVTDMSYMFAWCYVTTIYASDDFDVTNVTEDMYMFYDSTNLIGGRGTRVSYTQIEGSTNPTDKSYARIDKVGQPGYFTDKNDTVLNNIYYKREVVDEDNITVKIYNTSGDDRILLPNNTLCSKDYSVEGDPITIIEIVDAIEPYSMAYAFAGLKLKSIIGLENISTVNVTDMSGLFHRSGFAGTLDLTALDTTHVTNMEDMFSGNDDLTDIVFGSNFTTANVESMYCMFNGCSSLNTLDLTKFDTAKVTSMSYMFQDCSSLAVIDVPELETDSLTAAEFMFNRCSSVAELDMSNFDVSRVTDLSGMFDDCSGLTTLDLSNFNTANATDMSYMFEGCSSLTSIDVSSFDTSNVENMYHMFYDCTGITELDISNFNTAKVKEFRGMFAASNEDSTLQTIYASPDFVVGELMYSFSDENLFDNRLALKGEKETVYDGAHVHADYARIDGGTEAPGYFTEKTPLGFVELTGKVAVGETLTVTVTGSNPKVGNITYAWKRIDKNGNEEYITDATGSTYTATVNDVAHLLACDISGSSTTRVVTVVTKTRVLGENKDVTFDMRGIYEEGGVSYQPEALEVAVGDYVTKPDGVPNFIEGHALVGWYTEETYQNEWNFDTDIVEDDLILYARWNDPIYYSVDANSNTLHLYNDLGEGGGRTLLTTQQFGSDLADAAPWLRYEDSNLSRDITSVVIEDDIYPTYMTYWWCSTALVSVTGLEKLHTDDVVDMSGLFQYAMSLNPSSLDLSHFNTAKVKNMHAMFENLGTNYYEGYLLDLSSFDTSSVTDMSDMFNGMRNIMAIYASDTFVTTNVTNSENMFSGCDDLKGANGTKTSSYPYVRTAEYARIDGKDGKPGYFSEKPENPYTIHVKYIDELGGSMSLSSWKTSTDAADLVMTVNGNATTTMQAYPYDEVVMEFRPKENYKMFSVPFGSKEENDSISKSTAYSWGFIEDATGFGMMDFVMENGDLWVYVMLEKEENTVAGSVTTYYKLWDGYNWTATTSPAGGTVTATMASGAPAADLAQGDTIDLTITPNEGYQLSKLRAVYWYVGSEVEYEFGTAGGDEITGITYDNVTGVGTVEYTISEVMDSNRLILEATFMKDMEYDLECLVFEKDGRDYTQNEDSGTITAMVDGNVVTKLKAGDLAQLTVTPGAHYHLVELEAVYAYGSNAKEITLDKVKTLDNTYTFLVESTYFTGTEPTYISVQASFKYGYSAKAENTPVGGSFSIVPAGSSSNDKIADGDMVGIVLSKEDGFNVDQIIVKDKDGNLITTSEYVPDAVYQFEMPASDVTVSVTFDAATTGATKTLTGYQSVSTIQQYLNLNNVSEVLLSSSGYDKEFTIDSALTIPEGKKLTLDLGTLMKVTDSITIEAGGSLENNGEIINMGTIQAASSGTATTFTNNGTLFSAGDILFDAPSVVVNNGEFVASDAPSSFDNHSTDTTLINDSTLYVGSCGQTMGYGVWEIGSICDLTFYGTGDMEDYEMISDSPWFYVRENITDITIPMGVTRIGNNAFYGCSNVQEVAIPIGVTSIGMNAFCNCQNLTTVVLPTTLTFIGGHAFENCAVTSVTYTGAPDTAGIYLPPELEVVTEKCFYNCPLAATVVVPEHVYQLGSEAFGMDSSHTNSALQEIWLPENLQSIYGSFTNRSGLTKIHYAGTEEEWEYIYISGGSIPDTAEIWYDSSYSY